jgi:hypothetical protein
MNSRADCLSNRRLPSIHDDPGLPGAVEEGGREKPVSIDDHREHKTRTSYTRE